MKKTLFLFLAALTISLAANAQNLNGKLNAIGIRGGWGAELSYQRYVAPENRIEGTLGFNRYGFSLEGMYQWTFSIDTYSSGELKWYVGPGVGIGSWDNDDYDNGFSAGILGQIGIEYAFRNAPIQLSIDYRPGFYFVPEGVFDSTGFALGVRFCF